MNTSHLTSGDAFLDAKIREWLLWDRNLKTSDYVKKLVKTGQFEKLRTILMCRMKFTVKGLKGQMGAGYNALNDLMIVQTSQGILKYLEKVDRSGLKSRGIVIGYDARYHSKRFAELMATVFIQHNFPVRLFNSCVPTPFIPYAVFKFQSVMGIMITGSGSGKYINGLKIYGPNGAQIVSPVDEDIEENILQNLQPLESSWDTQILQKSDMKINPLPDILKGYMDMICYDIPEEYKEINKKYRTKFIYTPLHGVGFIYFARAMETVNLKLIPVPEQKYPNPDFPTVKEPNFYDGYSNLRLAEETALSQDATVIIVNNPDCSRLIVAERVSSGEFNLISPNEVATLLGWWAFHCYQCKMDANDKLTDLYIIGSIFNTKIMKTMSKIEGFQFIEMLNGFKWIGNIAKEILNRGKSVIFSYEEYGYMFNTSVLDKDGIQAGVHLACLAAYLSHHNITLREHLEDIYTQYGFHTSIKSFYVTENPLAIDSIFTRLRNYETRHNYPKSLQHGKYPIKFVRDLQAGYDSAETGNKTTLPHDPNIELITFTFENGLIGTIYANRLENNLLRFFIELCARPETGSYGEIKSHLYKLINAFIEEYIQPEENQLVISQVSPLLSIPRIHSSFASTSKRPIQESSEAASAHGPQM